MTRRAAASIVVATVALACAAAALGSPSGRWLVAGHVYVPNERRSPANHPSHKPLPAVGALVQVFAKSHLVAHMRVKPNGSFSFRLGPGRYRLVASLTPPKLVRVKQCASRQVTVQKNRVLRVHMECSLF
jgi:hypothetical protein